MNQTSMAAQDFGAYRWNNGIYQPAQIMHKQDKNSDGGVSREKFNALARLVAAKIANEATREEFAILCVQIICPWKFDSSWKLSLSETQRREKCVTKIFLEFEKNLMSGKLRSDPFLGLLRLMKWRLIDESRAEQRETQRTEVEPAETDDDYDADKIERLADPSADFLAQMLRDEYLAELEKRLLKLGAKFGGKPFLYLQALARDPVPSWEEIAIEFNTTVDAVKLGIWKIRKYIMGNIGYLLGEDEGL